MKHNARLPRTAGLKTLSELSTSLTKAGLDPSRIEQRAELIAKARGLERKRKRDEEMDVDEVGDSGEDEDGEGEEGGDWMDVDGEGDDATTSPKRRKSNTGTAVTAVGKHAPRTNRQTAGMRDQTQVSKAVKLRNLGQRERNMHAKAGESDRAIRTKMVGRCDQRVYPTRSQQPICSRSTCFPENENQERLRDDELALPCLRASPHLRPNPRLTMLSFTFWSFCVSCLHAYMRNRWALSVWTPFVYSCWSTSQGFDITRSAMCRYRRIYICHIIIHQVSTKVVIVTTQNRKTNKRKRWVGEVSSKVGG